MPPKIAELLQETLAGKTDLNHFFASLEGVPGKDAFYKRLRAGTRVNVLRSSGEMDSEGWIIDPAPEKSELGNEAMIRVHNKQKHLAKTVPLIDLITWNV